MRSGGSKSRITSAGLILALAVVLQGCSTMGKILGTSKNPPDEFAVVNQPPLALPPDFALTPPNPGEPTPQNVAPSAQAINALFPGRTTLPPPASSSEQALLNSIGAGDADTDIRSMVGDDDTIVVEKGPILADLLNVGERDSGPDGSRIERVASEDIGPDGR